MKHYYAGYSYMGTNLTFDCPCWKVLRFSSKQARNEFVKNNWYRNGNIVIRKITFKDAETILGRETNDKKWHIYDTDGDAEILSARYI